MPVEILPRLVRLYNELPRDIPLLWPDNPVSTNYLQMMFELEVLKGNRTLVDREVGSVYRANKLYLYHADDDNFPHMNIQEYLNLQKLIIAGMSRKFSSISIHRTSKVITIINRQQSIRSVTTHKEILELLRQTYPQHDVRDYVIESKPPADYLRYGGARVFYESDIVISPHGASLSNILFSRPGAGVIELGWGKLPQDYMCFSRNLKLRYHLVCGNGHHNSQLEINPQAVLSAVTAILEDMEKDSPYTKK